jgi:hypothetical protein
MTGASWRTSSTRRPDRVADRAWVGRSHSQAGALRQQPAKPKDDAGVSQPEQHCQRSIGQRAADDPVQVVQPVAQDRCPRGNRQGSQTEPDRHAEQGARAREPDRQAGQDDHTRHDHHQRGQGHPLELQALPRARRKRPTRDPAATTTRRTGAATMTLAHQRQRGDGSDPVGVTSRSRPTEVSAV